MSNKWQITDEIPADVMALREANQELAAENSRLRHALLALLGEDEVSAKDSMDKSCADHPAEKEKCFVSRAAKDAIEGERKFDEYTEMRGLFRCI